MAAASGRSRPHELLLDQAQRPGGVGLLADSLHGLLQELKMSAASSSELDGLGAQAVKHTVLLLRGALRFEEEEDQRERPAAEAAAEEAPEETASAPQSATAQQEETSGEPAAQPPSQEPAPEEPLQAPEEPLPAPEADGAAPPSLGRSRLSALLPEWVLNLLRYQHERGSQEAVPTEAEAMIISRLVDMGFSDIVQIRALYCQYGDDCNAIASHLLDRSV
ncbi:cytochrome c1-like [Pollicipes pollicipes]|uniref:cytochrome c1-like n=1 Tax=Pollicipes pollicipes TaxID=41117 RepID=UPI001885645F|nr:cytochrome c1-like [Pollicipes pollicipes]